jgi:hypothetical protein
LGSFQQRVPIERGVTLCGGLDHGFAGFQQRPVLVGTAWGIIGAPSAQGKDAGPRVAMMAN